MTVGIGLPITGSSNVVGTANQTTIGADFTFDTYMIQSPAARTTRIIFEIEEGFVSIDIRQVLRAAAAEDGRLHAGPDHLHAAAGPRASGLTGASGVSDDSLRVDVLVIGDHRGEAHAGRTMTMKTCPANEYFMLGKAFAPVSIREGVGINVRLLGAAGSGVARLARRPRLPAEPVQWRLRAL